jgi:hypothetical protein
MTMTREAKRDAEQVLKGRKTLDFQSPKLRRMCREQGRAGYAMTATEYAREYLGRRATNVETAYLNMKEHAGWTFCEDTNTFRGPRRTVRVA